MKIDLAEIKFLISTVVISCCSSCSGVVKAQSHCDTHCDTSLAISFSDTYCDFRVTESFKLKKKIPSS